MKLDFGKILGEALPLAAFLVFVGWLIEVFLGGLGIGFLVPISLADIMGVIKVYIGTVIGLFGALVLKTAIMKK